MDNDFIDRSNPAALKEELSRPVIRSKTSMKFRAIVKFLFTFVFLFFGSLLVLDLFFKPPGIFYVLTLVLVFVATYKLNKNSINLLALCLLLGGCSLTLPVDGRIGEGDRFLGEATGYLDRTGTMSVTTVNGLHCSGAFKYQTSATGDGTLTCDDGRSGSFLFNSNGNSGNGFGTLNDGKEFFFAFGSPSHTKNFRE